MADQLIIQPSAAHSNVATVYQGVTPMLAGWRCGCVPLESQQKGAPVDVSAYTQLTLALEVQSMRNRHGWENGEIGGAALHVAVEHLVGGRWQLLHQFAPLRDPVAAPHAVVTNVGDQVRASWYFARSDMPATIAEEVAITWSLTAEALPSAA